METVKQFTRVITYYIDLVASLKLSPLVRSYFLVISAFLI